MNIQNKSYYILCWCDARHEIVKLYKWVPQTGTKEMQEQVWLVEKDINWKLGQRLKFDYTDKRYTYKRECST